MFTKEMFPKETDLEAVKEEFNCFLENPVKTSTDSHGDVIIIHPVFDSIYQHYTDSNGDEQYFNILQSPENWEKAKAQKGKAAADADHVISIGRLLKKEYRLRFLEYMGHKLSLEDFSLYLANFWGDSIEEATTISGVEKSSLKHWLSMCDKDVFMGVEGKRLFDSFDEEVTIYRSTTDLTRRIRKSALTWTASYDDAIWYAERYLAMGIDKSYIYRATIDKKHIYGCVPIKSSDVVVDNKGLRDVTLINTLTDL